MKAVIFDAGGVIVDSHKLLEKFTALIKQDKNELWDYLNKIVLPLCRGESRAIMGTC